MNLQDKRIVIGMDLDTADEGVEKTYARRIENCRVNIVNNGRDGIVEPVLGNTEIINDQLPGFIDVNGFFVPTGSNKTIGSYSDNSKNKVYFFNYNSARFDCIFCFDGVSFTRLVIGDLGWSEDLIIHSVTLIDNLLSWTEGGSKYPRQINVLESLSNPIEFDISLIKTPPTFPLQTVLQQTGVVDANFYRRENYYYIYRFVYDNGQQSSWSPYSKLVSSKYTTLVLDDSIWSKFKINEWRVFREGGIDGLNYNTKIKYIDFAYANTYLGPFKLFKRTKVDEVISVSGWDQLILSDTDLSAYGLNKDLEVTFRNDLSFSVIAPTDTERPYDDIWPCEALETSDNRNIIANTLEGFAEFELIIGNVTQGVKVVPSFKDNSPLPSAAELLGNFMVWKNNSKYGIGLVFYNEFGQKSGVYTDQRLKVLTPPDYRTDLKEKLWCFDFDIAGTPPMYATHYQVVRTNNQKVSRWVQGITNDILYVSGYNENGDPIFLRKIIGTAGVENKETQTLFIPPLGATPGERRVNNMIGPNQYNNPNQIYEFGLSSNDQSIYREVTYWARSAGGNFNQAGLVFTQQRYRPVPLYTWGGKPDSEPFNSDEQDYIIGYTPTGEAIYIGGVNRRGEKINEFSKQGLDAAIDILIDIYNWNNTTNFEENQFNSTSTIARQVYNPSCETPYVFQEGDRLNIYYSSTGTYSGILDLEIKDFVEGRYLKVKFDQRLLEDNILGAGAFIEIFTPNTGSDDIFFYEYGDCYPINNAKTANRQYSKTSFSIFEGDTHYMMYAPMYARDIRVNYRGKGEIDFRTGRGYSAYPFFSMNPDNLNRAGIWEKANGRPNVVLLDGERQTRRRNTIRFSDRYIDGASINGTSTFYSFNSYQLDYDWGPIRKMTSQEEVLLVNCEQEAALVYINKAMISTADGSDRLIVSDKLLNSAKKLPGGYGCVNPESVSRYNEYIYFWSKIKGCALRYNVFNSVFDISGNYKARSYFYNKVSDKCFTGFDPKFRTQYFRFDDENIGFIDPASQDYPNTWSSFFSFLPEQFAYIQLQMYTFFEGKIFKHEEGPVNTFYGVKYPSRINVLFNAEPNMQKIANFISLESDKPLWCESITNQDGQITDIADGAFERINKDWQCDVPGDTSTGLSKWEGDLMSSHLFNVTFRYDVDSMFRLRYLNLYSQISQRTNK